MYTSPSDGDPAPGFRLPDRRRPRLPFLALTVFLLASLFCLFLASACESRHDRVIVSGKTVYMGMGIEEVPIRVLRWDGSRWEEHSAVRSGYHGSFVVAVPPGRYRLEASGEIPRGSGAVPLAGSVDGIDVLPGKRRVDRVVIELAPGRR